MVVTVNWDKKNVSLSHTHKIVISLIFFCNTKKLYIEENKEKHMPVEETTLQLINRSPLQPPLKAFERFINRTHQITSDSLKASIVAPFANITREEITLARPTTALESSTSPKQRVASSILFAFILFYILFSCNIYNISCP